MDISVEMRLQISVLQLIKNNGDFSNIVGEFYTYEDIRQVIQKFKLNGVTSDLSGKLTITSLGEEYLKKIMIENGISNKGPHILPQYKYFTRKVGRFDIYLDDRDIPH